MNTEITEKYSILLVEDNPDHQSFEKRTIERISMVKEVITAKTAYEAREFLQNQSIDLMVLDYDLPDTDGLLFLESLTKINNDIPVVMVTGLGNEKIAVRAMKLGAYDYVVKDKDYLTSLPDVITRSLDKLRLSRTLRRMEKQLKESEERYQNLYENANAGFVTINIETKKFLKPNKQMVTITGYSPQQMENMCYLDIVAPEDRDRVRAYHQAKIEENGEEDASPSELAFWITTADGKRKYINATLAVFPQIGEVFLTWNDITDRKILEEKLKKAHEKLKEHARQLEDEVDTLKKRLVIEPQLEESSDTEQKFNLDTGCTYLIKEKHPVKSYEIFKDFVSHGVFGLCISRTYPKRIQKLYNLEKTPIIWLSKSETEETAVSVTDLGGLLDLISKFVSESRKSIIIFDGLEYLITVNGFSRAIMYFNDLIETVMTNETMLVVPVNPDALENKEFAILERFTEEFIPELE